MRVSAVRRTSKIIASCIAFVALLDVVPVKGSARGHASSKAPDALLPEVWDGRQVSSHDGHRVGRVHKEAVFSEDHVAVLMKQTFLLAPKEEIV